MNIDELVAKAIDCEKKDQIDEAGRLYRAVLGIDPTSFNGLHGFGVVLYRKGQLQDAERWILKALSREPASAFAHNNLGSVLLALRRPREAIKHYARAAAIMPDFADARHNLALALAETGNLEEARRHYEAALKINPEHVHAHNGLGALMALERPGDSIAHFRKAVSLRNEYPQAHNNLGAALEAVGDSSGAIASFRKAIDLDGSYADPHANLGATFLRNGKLDDARREFELAVQLDPQSVRFLIHLSEVRRFHDGDPYIGRMEQISQQPNRLNEEQLIPLHFALSKAHADTGDHEAAARHMVKANTLKRRKIDYRERDALNELARTEEIFTSQLMQRHSGAGNHSRLPIFIVGMPRSGTTLVEQILASHELVFGADELSYFSDGVSNLSNRTKSAKTFPEFASTMTAKEILLLGDEYVAALRALSPAAERISDKMPGNFRFVGLIHLALPDARIIHMRRNPIDTCLSCYSILFRDGQAFTYDLSELARLYKGYDRLMRHWHRVLPANIMIDVQYEDLVGNFEGEARRILAHCGLEWSPACLEFHKTNRPVRTASATQVRQPLYSTAVGRWRPYAKMLQPLIEEFGFDHDDSGETRAKVDL